MTVYGQHPESSVHDAVGAYVLGILNDAEATDFEMHLAGCDYCAAQLDDLTGLEPMLATLADFPPGVPGTPSIGTPSIGSQLAVKPSPMLLDRLVDEVAERRAQKRRRGFYMVAAAAALIIGGPTIAVVASSGDEAVGNAAVSGATLSANPAEDSFANMDDKVQATDSTTKVTATVGMETKARGTHVVLELKNITGPKECELVAVSKNGEEQTMVTWAVPRQGYGVETSTSTSTDTTGTGPLYMDGGAAMARNDIDHFEVRMLDGKILVNIDA